MTPPNFVCYNWLPLVADHILDFSPEEYKKIGAAPLHNHYKLDTGAIKDGEMLFVKTDFIVSGFFSQNVLPHIHCKFNLITGCSSYQPDRDGGNWYTSLLHNTQIKKWFCVHPPAALSAKLIPLPIGFEEPDREGGDQQILKNHHASRTPFSLKKNKILIPYHNLTTNAQRQSLVSELSKKTYIDIQTEKQDFNSYLSLLNEYKFIICLEGSGPDLHRNYESLLVGSIPINIKNSTEHIFKFHGASGIFLNNWEDLTSDKLEKILEADYNQAPNDDLINLPHLINKVKELS